MKLTFKTGIAKMSNTLKALAGKFPDRVANALYTEMSIDLTESKRYVPVGPGGGELRASGRVHDPERRGRSISCTISYGSGPSAPYALAVHEHLSEFSPPSWVKAEAAGDGVHWRVPGTGPKYLERVINASRSTMHARLVRRLQLKDGSGLS